MSLKIVIKPLKGDQFEVDVEPTDNVGVLKAKVAQLKAELPAETQKLIYQGRILTDTMSIADVGIKAGEFVVCMAAKPKPAADAPAAAPAAAPAVAPAAADSGPAPMDTAASALVGGGEMEGTIKQLMDMGFERAQVERCLRAAFNNPDRAVEYLMSGIPAGVEQAEGGAAPPAGGAAPTPPAAGGAAPTPTPPPAAAGGATPFPSFAAAGAGGGGGGGPALSASGQAALDQMRNDPRFVEFAQLLAQNPGMLPQILPAIAQSNPGLIEVLRENPEALQQALREAVQGAAGGGAGGGMPPHDPQDPVAVMLAAAAAGGGGAPPGTTVVRLTPEEREAVNRLMSLGFDQQAALQAYLACDKNEELAANFLFDAPMDMDQ